MGYRKEKIIIQGKKRRLKIIFSCILSAILLALAIFSFIIPPKEWKYRIKKPDLESRNEGELRIHFIDVGQGDCTLIELPDGKIMLIDGGDGRREGTLAILRRLNALHIDKIDYLVATHADNDHCGGLSEVVRQKEILNAYLPPIPIEKAEGAYAEFIDELSKKDCEWKYASRAVSLNGTGEYPYVLSFLHPYLLTEEQMQSDEYAVSSNVLSTVIWLDYQGVSTLFTGDAPSSVEKLLMRDSDLHAFEKQGVQLRSTEILKVSHHGSADATTLGFLTFLRAKTAVISCGKDNLYGHPDEETMKNLQTAKLDVYRTDEDGTVVITITNAGTYTVN